MLNSGVCIRHQVLFSGQKACKSFYVICRDKCCASLLIGQKQESQASYWLQNSETNVLCDPGHPSIATSGEYFSRESTELQSFAKLAFKVTTQMLKFIYVNWQYAVPYMYGFSCILRSASKIYLQVIMVQSHESEQLRPPREL